MEEGVMTKVNFYIYYEIDEDEVKTVLRADEYDGDCEGSYRCCSSPCQPCGRGRWLVSGSVWGCVGVIE